MGFRIAVAMVTASMILGLPGALSAGERRGADITVSLRSGRSVSGELIAVKPDSLLLLSPAGNDESVGLADIATIRVFKKRRPGQAALYGTLLGAVAGGLLGYAAAPKGMEENPGLIAAVLGLGGAVLGGFIASASQSGPDPGREFIIAGRPEASVKGALAELNRLARFRSLP